MRGEQQAARRMSQRIPEFYQQSGLEIAQNFLIVPHVGRGLREIEKKFSGCPA